MAFWESDPVLQGGGECGALMRAMDWTNTPLGAPASWPNELRTVVGIALGSSQPMLIVWGPAQTTLYNDGYAAMCGNRHPAALGKPFRDLWFDIWDTVDPIITAAYGGIGTSMEDITFTMHRKGYAEETHFAFSYTPVRDSGGAVLGMFCACTETTHEVFLRRQLQLERKRMMQIFERALGAIAILEGPQHVFSYANAEYESLIGRGDIIGKSVAEALPEVVAQGFVALLDNVLASGEPHIGRNVPVALQRHAGREPERRALDFLYHPVTNSAGEVESIFVQALDVTDRVEAAQRQVLLNRELGHRMKNQLSLVQAIVNQTLRSTKDAKAASEILAARIAVLANAHDILIAGSTGHTRVGDIVQEVIKLHDDPRRSRIRASGPEQRIASRPALSLSLILHELSTNAAKYGALSRPDGHVEFLWRLDRNESGPTVVLDWIEHGGPVVEEPLRHGAGSRLIRAGLSGTVHHTVTLDYDAGGLRCQIVADLESFQND